MGGWVHRHWWAVAWLNSCWAVVGRLASVGFIGVSGLWCGWCVMVALVGFVVVGVGVAWWVRVGVALVDFFFFVGVVGVGVAVAVAVVVCVCGCDECLL